MAVVVMHKGSIIAEQYHPDVYPEAALPGYSMAKSMTATLVGLLVQEKGLDVHSVIPNAGDLTHSGVTIDQLLRMTSGINVEETGSGYDANSIMLTQVHDAAAYAVSRGLSNKPGTRYAYTGAGSVVLARFFSETVAPGDPAAAFRFIDDRLLHPLQLGSVILEADGAGTFLGSSFMLASARDWAKLGELYRQKGVWNGKQILPEGWTDYVCTATPQSGAQEYGAGFWTARKGGRDSIHEELPRLPEDACFMHGTMNQAVYIIPSMDLVIARLGATRDYLKSGELDLVANVVAAMKSPES